MAITATFRHRDGYQFNIVYRTRGGFLRAVTKSRNSSLVNAVDDVKVFVIKPENLEQYRRMK